VKKRNLFLAGYVLHHQSFLDRNLSLLWSPLAVNTGQENSAQMRLLQLIRDFNSEEVSPTIAEIRSRNHAKDSFFLKSDVSELLEKRYIETLSLPDQDNAEYNRTGHRITEKGRQILERYSSQVKNFVSSLDDKYERSENNNLYVAIETNRDLLHFAYFQGWITKNQIEKMARKLGISAERVWWGDSQGERWSGHPGGIYPHN